jgi:hydrogenase-4 component E
MDARVTYGSLPYDLAHMLGGGVLVLSFVLLYQRRVNAVVTVYALQAVVLAAAASCRAWPGRRRSGTFWR